MHTLAEFNIWYNYETIKKKTHDILWVDGRGDNSLKVSRAYQRFVNCFVLAISRDEFKEKWYDYSVCIPVLKQYTQV